MEQAGCASNIPQNCLQDLLLFSIEIESKFTRLFALFDKYVNFNCSILQFYSILFVLENRARSWEQLELAQRFSPSFSSFLRGLLMKWDSALSFLWQMRTLMASNIHLPYPDWFNFPSFGIFVDNFKYLSPVIPSSFCIVSEIPFRQECQYPSMQI